MFEAVNCLVEFFRFRFQFSQDPFNIHNFSVTLISLIPAANLRFIIQFHPPREPLATMPKQMIMLQNLLAERFLGQRWRLGPGS